MTEAQGSWLVQNWNTFACSLIVNGLQRLGVTAWFVSPGYRDAPMIAALQTAENLTLVSCWDERAAAYQALGFAKATLKPAVLICTSGTAAANYLPALIEARVEQLPLLVITADRPFELVHAAAQQVIDQRQLFGRFVKRSLDFPTPSATFNPSAWLSYLRMLVHLSLDDSAGPVHINLPFAMPLDPVELTDRPAPQIVDEVKSLTARMSLRHGKSHRALHELEQAALYQSIRSAKRGFIIVGRLQSREEQRAAAAIAERLAWPCYVDVGSGVKGRLEYEIADPEHPQVKNALIAYNPDCCLHLGRRLITRFFDDFLAIIQPQAYWVMSSEDGVQDPAHLPERQQINCSITCLSSFLTSSYAGPIHPQEKLMQATLQARMDFKVREQDGFCFAAIAQSISELIPKRQHGLFLGNSTAIRAFNSWCDPSLRRWPTIAANRGVSGIEGLLATTLGLEIGSHHAWTIVIGDIALIHDLNSVLSMAKTKHQIILVLVNNGGGRLFEQLSIKSYPWVKDPLMTTPHSFHFAGLAEMAGVHYQRCLDQMAFARFYSEALASGESWFLECQQEALADSQFIQRIRNPESDS